MASINAPQIKQIREQHGYLLSFALDDFLRSDLPDQINFRGVESVVKLFLEILVDINRHNLEKVPSLILNEYSNALNPTQERLMAFRGLTLGSNSANSDNRDQLRNRFTSQFSDFHVKATALLSAANVFDTKSKEHINEIQQTKNAIAEEHKLAKDAREKVEALLIATQKASQEIVIVSYATIFEQQSQEYGKTSNKWLTWLIILLGAVIITALIFLLQSPFSENITTAYAIQYSVTKVIIFTAFFYAVNLSQKNFKAHRHNSILNKHRANALRSFEAFVKSVKEDDQQTKNAILLEVTKTIFSNQQTGYGINEESDNSNTMIEIIKNVPMPKVGS